MATINGVEANRQFQANVQLVQAQRQAAVELDAALKKEKDAKKKKELQTQFDAVMKKLNENNEGMQKATVQSGTQLPSWSRDGKSTCSLREEAAKIEKPESGEEIIARRARVRIIASTRRTTR